jgi:hypothetical protein
MVITTDVDCSGYYSMSCLGGARRSTALTGLRFGSGPCLDVAEGVYCEVRTRVGVILTPRKSSLEQLLDMMRRVFWQVNCEAPVSHLRMWPPGAAYGTRTIREAIVPFLLLGKECFCLATKLG